MSPPVENLFPEHFLTFSLANQPVPSRVLRQSVKIDH